MLKKKETGATWAMPDLATLTPVTLARTRVAKKKAGTLINRLDSVTQCKLLVCSAQNKLLNRYQLSAICGDQVKISRVL